MLPNTGSAPAMVEIRSSEIVPSLMLISQSSKALMLCPTSAGWIRFTGTTATCFARGNAALLFVLSIAD